MKRFVGVVLGMCLATAAYAADDIAAGQKETIVIGQVQVPAGLREEAHKQGVEAELDQVALSIETQVIAALSSTRVFQIVDPSLVNAQAISAMAAQPTDAAAVKTVQKTGAKYVFLPQIDGFEDRAATVTFNQLERQSTTHTIFISAVVRIVDTATGELLPDVPSVQITKNGVSTLEGMGDAGGGSAQTIVAAAKEVAAQLAQGSVSRLRPAKVLLVSGNQIMINRGSDFGFDVGDVLEIFSAQDVKDEDSGETFRNEIKVGAAHIIRGDQKQSYALLDGECGGVAKGCIVRLLKQPPAAPGAEPADMTPGSSEKPLDWSSR